MAGFNSSWDSAASGLVMENRPAGNPRRLTESKQDGKC